MMQKRYLGTTNIAVSVLGLGTVKWGRNQGVKYPHAFAVPDEKTLKNLLVRAKEHGINFLDTAPAYGESEMRLGHLLKEERKDWVICTKAGEIFHDGQSHFDFTRSAIIKSVENSLRALQTDYLDIVLIHSNGDDVTLIEKFGVLETLNSLKERGLIKATGMSTKTVEGGMLALTQSDVAMVTAHPAYLDEIPVIERALELGKGILIKKALASGHLNHLNTANPVADSIRFNLAHKAVASIIVGTISQDHLDENVRAAISIQL